MPRRRNRSPRVRPAPDPAGDAVVDDVANQGAPPCDCEDCMQAGIVEEPLKQSTQKNKSWISSRQWPFMGDDSDNQEYRGPSLMTKVWQGLSQLQYGLAQHPILTAMAAILFVRLMLHVSGFNLCVLKIP
ncbi:hypothetical protein FJT64_027292 [Amphibalanus amphitrite]|uniref:Uncharacterized protein n=1 Tax=Amphibalanus amphitrite TaxID=1232801 RepID=A0A6A4WDT7_AMPAM|nr:uncharacterized protein LOC122369801 [Amphibalanus amphitrite]XP_043242355.1 uncharacterized protein LOC122392009 [Amphibalanus amphitrite]KAF0300151.1 hypothetical protein FJT64_027292 [Amphibalanus amphitrite]